MVRLLKSPPPRPAHREYLRILLLAAPLVLVMLLMAQLREPETAEQINAVFAQLESGEPAQKRTAASAEPAPSRELFPGIRRELLDTIQDNTYFRNAEQDAWFHFIEVLQRTPAEQLASAHSLEADYTQLIDQPAFYRGKLVTAHGHVRQVTKQTPAANDLGLDAYYRVVVQPTGGVNWPIFVYCLELPDALPLGENPAGSVKVAGLFFKNLSYSAREGMGTAPVILAKNIEYFKTAPGEPPDVARRPVAADDWREATPHDADEQQAAAGESQPAAPAFRDVLMLAGWNLERLAAFDDGEPFSAAQREEALQLLRRLRTFDSASLHEWAHDDPAPSIAMTKPDVYRGQLIQLAGRVTRVTKHALFVAEAERLDLAEYFECQLELNDAAGTATLLTTRVPSEWLQTQKLDEPATAAALYVKHLPDGDAPRTLWLTKAIAWRPTTVNEPYISLGESLLGRHGMDVGLLDTIAPRGRLRALEREAFYQMLAAAGQVEAEKLAGMARGNLPAVQKAWQHELATADDEATRNLAREVVRRAAAGHYSVAPLFNEPRSQIGRLVVVDGAARRAVRVEVGPSDVERRFRFDHYYEVEVFTDDSQNYPLVFCVRELPAGFPTGSSIHVPVRVAGFFFKDWLYRTRGDVEGDGSSAQYAPLLVGRGPLVLVAEEGGSMMPFVLGALFVAVLAGIWTAAAWHARGDRLFRERTPAAGFSLPPGRSLNELNVPPPDVPMKE